MSADLESLYRDQVLAHSREPCNFCRLEDADHVVAGSNPLCGDSLQVYIALDGDAVRALSFEGHGCAITVASASMMTQMLEGTTCCDAVRTIERVHGMLTGGDGEPLDAELAEAPVAALAAVRRYPTRVKCATLAWQAVHGALTEDADTVTTE
ncbi:MAG: Fe-S cluster assembly sulfur transfer protein SufU [Pseudomonadota bacterium]